MEKGITSSDTDSIEIIVNGKHYALLPLCSFHDLPTEFRHNQIECIYGLKDIFASKNVYEVVDDKKYMLCKIKYGF